MPLPVPPELGFLAISGHAGVNCRALLDGGLARVGVEGAEHATGAGLEMATWGMTGRPPEPRQVLPLTPVLRVGGRRQSLADVARWLSTGSESLAELLPPFAAAHLAASGSLRVATDSLGFRQLYVARGDGWAGVSTSARVLGQCLGSGLDERALAVQSRLGWQVGHRTLFEGVSQLPAGHLVALDAGVARLQEYAGRGLPARRTAPGDIENAVEDAATLLRRHLTALVEEHRGDVDLQLTGGQDSRLLLSAIPLADRAGATALTVRVPGSDDAAIAGRLAVLSAMPHRVVELGAVEPLSPREAYAACARAAARLEYQADPVALAAIASAEAQLPQRLRLSGLGGEVARGFYYLGRIAPAPVNRARTDRLASWRMFVNERVAPDALEPGFEAWAQEFSLSEAHRLIADAASDWFTATDEFYLWNRMQRWAGARDTAVVADREVVNPMLDHHFLDLARSLSPAVKQNAQYLSRIQMRLDPALGRIPLDGRPAPDAFARRGPLGQARIATATAHKALRKARQRLGGSTRPPAGGQVLAARVAQHWRDAPSDLEPARRTGVFRESWLDQVASGAAEPAPADVALLVNLCCAGDG